MRFYQFLNLLPPQALRAMVLTGRTEVTEIQNELDERPVVRSVWQWEDVEWEKLTLVEKVRAWFDIVFGRTWDELRVRPDATLSPKMVPPFLFEEPPAVPHSLFGSQKRQTHRTSGQLPGRTASGSRA